MQARPRHHHYSYDEYLTLEETANVRHEYLEGEIYGMAGGSREHAALAAGLIAAFGAQLEGRPCVPHSSDLRVRILATGLATYPDVTLICGHVELDPDDPTRHTVINPTVVCEVLSPSTEDYDRGDKLDQYKLIPSLLHVVLVAHDARRIEAWSRDQGSEWNLLSGGPGERVALSSVGVVLDVDALYRDPLSPSGYLA